MQSSGLTACQRIVQSARGFPQAGLHSIATPAGHPLLRRGRGSTIGIGLPGREGGRSAGRERHDSLVKDVPTMAGMPVTRVVLYKHGVGYFEREGTVDGDQSVGLEFKQAEV